MTPSDVLSALEQTDALLTGHFELRSGLHSEHFFQCANLLRFPRVAERLCAALVAKLQEALGDDLRADTVVAPAMGGITVGHEVARALDVKSIFVEKKDDALYLKRFSIEPGERFVVAEDVITRGGRVQETIDIVERAGGIVAAVAVLVDRSGGKARFGFPTVSLLEQEPVTYEPETCPLCERGLPLVHPGS